MVYDFERTFYSLRTTRTQEIQPRAQKMAGDFPVRPEMAQQDGEPEDANAFLECRHSSSGSQLSFVPGDDVDYPERKAELQAPVT